MPRNAEVIRQWTILREIENARGGGMTIDDLAARCDVTTRTIRRDLQALARQRTRSADLTAERHRLLEAAKLVEHHAWELFDGLPAADTNGRLGALGKVLASQVQVVKLVGDLAALDLEARLAALEQSLATGEPTP